MKYLIAIDDTDDLTKDTSTGKIAAIIGKRLEKEGMKISKGVSRHQLLLKEGVPYTSHNSAMCIDLEGEMDMDTVLRISVSTIKKFMAASSNPGLCILEVQKVDDIKALVDFGRKAQNVIIKKEEAINLASTFEALVLKEIAGNAQGIIGALAGIGLRLSGNDGTFRGKIKFPNGKKKITVKDLKDKFDIDDVIDIDTESPLKDYEEILNDEFSKLLYRNYKKLAYVYKTVSGEYMLFNKEKSMKYDNENLFKNKICEYFTSDNDYNECITGDRTCYNCLYRRLKEDGISCSRI